MAVKDLIRVFDPDPDNIQLTTTTRQSTNGSDAHRTLPRPRGARFISHSPPAPKVTSSVEEQVELGSFGPSASSLPVLPYSRESISSEHLDEVEKTSDIADVKERMRPTILPVDGEDPFSAPMSARDYGTPTKPRIEHLHSLDPLASPLLQRKHRFPPHSPIPATTLFARKAAPLFLPKLDTLLESLPKPEFSFPAYSRNEPQMFPPMDRLAASGRSIEDLELNSQEPPFWRNRKTILGSAVNIILGFTGSSALATFYSLQGLVNTIQVFALVLRTIVPIGKQNVVDSWRKLFLGTIPNILALNFASTLIESLTLLLIFMAIAMGLLVYFFRSTPLCERYVMLEGLQKTEFQGSKWGILVVTFLLTVIYLPLSTMAIHVLVWSEDLWPAGNPYINSTTFPPQLAPLGPPSEFRDPLDFCWTTTMKKNEINYSAVVIIVAVLVVASLTVWFPLALRKVINRSAPRVDPFTELGRPRGSENMDREYQRLLSRDRNPFAFLYGGFRRSWGSYESTYLFAKFSTLFIIAVIDSQNCLFRNLSRKWVPIARQILLVAFMIGFFVTQCILAPFLDPVNNASEWVSRLNYVSTSAVALGVALDIPGKNILDTYILYIIYIVTYGFTFYFTIINTGIMHRLVKRISRRVDFSIDVFSPLMDTSIHLRRRIWQESITTLLLTSPDCKIPPKQPMSFAQARDLDFPPYLLEFAGTPAERHVENLKILREIGSVAYMKGVAIITGPDQELHKQLADEIQNNIVGPDSYWKPDSAIKPGCSSFFGNSWWVPFPPTLVMRYDDGPSVVIQEVKDLELFISQNTSRDIQLRREVRMSLRALDGQSVIWPYEHIEAVGANTLWSRRKRYSAKASTWYHAGVLSLKRRGQLFWHSIPLGSGFGVELKYAKHVQVSGDVIGLNDDFDLTPALARFISLNRETIARRIDTIELAISSYRRHHREESARKADALSYAFLPHVYDRPQADLTKWVVEHEHDIRVRQLIVGSEDCLTTAYERLSFVSKTDAGAWWYIFWDDFWRRNNDAISALKQHETDFNPYYPTSIAYTPLPRAALEAFLVQRGLLSRTPRWKDVFHSGFLNKIYMRLNEAAFHGSSRAIMFHLGEGRSEFTMYDVGMGQASTIGTGGGTDHDDAYVRPRPTYLWEGLLTDPVRTRRKHGARLFAKLGAWLGVTPLWRSGVRSMGVSLDVRLEGNRYVVLEDLHSEKSSPVEARRR
ncbi:hypothetical protein HGRIS_007967 [Hohenbuehelia grisea]|uniref:Uncharacterized protein n=1 Tax=Hohenbuehelia grisea TaxID=104357 RepID=A0ABR3J6H9_9AGAR